MKKTKARKLGNPYEALDIAWERFRNRVDTILRSDLTDEARDKMRSELARYSDAIMEFSNQAAGLRKAT